MIVANNNNRFTGKYFALQIDTSFQELSKQVMALQSLYSNACNSMQQESQAVRKNHALALLLFNNDTAKGLSPSPVELLKWDEQLDLVRDARITALHKIMTQLSPEANKFMAFYDTLFEQLNNRSITHECFIEFLKGYRELFKLGGDLALYQSNQARTIRRAIAKYS